MKHFKRRYSGSGFATVVVLLTAGINSACLGQSAPRSEPAADLQQLPPLEATEQKVEFAQQATEVGDRAVQRVGVEMEIETAITQANQTAHQSKSSMRRKQERHIKVEEVADGNARSALVTFTLSREMSPEGPQANKEVSQVIEGNTYRVTRRGDRLHVTDNAGAIPTQEEYALVVASLANLGLPNPLAAFLLEREIHVGDALQLPSDIAAEMLGFDQMGVVESFELELLEVREIDQRPCAVFQAAVAAAGRDGNPMQLRADGEVIIEIPTCRTVAATLTGPLALKTEQQDFHVKVSGTMLVAIQSRFGSAKK